MRDIAVKFDNVGDVITAGEFNSDQHEIENLVNTTGQTLDNSAGPDTDLYMMAKAAAAYGSGGDFYTDGGTGGSYVLTRATSLKAPPSLFDGMVAVFYPANSNPGTCTVNVSGFGVKALLDMYGASLTPGAIIAGELAVIRYHALSATFRLVIGGSTQWTSYNSAGGFIHGYKNKVPNGTPYIWSRGASFAAATDGQLTADMWRYNKTGVMVHTVAQSTDAPVFTYGPSLRMTCTTPQASIGPNDYASITTYAEGYDLASLVGSTQNRKISVGFWVKASVTGVYCVSFSNAALDRSYVAEYTVNASNTWEYKSFTLTFSATGGWEYINTLGLRVRFVLAAGSNLHATVGSWVSGDYYASSNQVNACATASNIFAVKNVQVEAGNMATAYDRPGYQAAAQRCLRYTSIHNTNGAISVAYGVTSTPTVFNARLPLQTQMRTVPTISGPTAYTVAFGGVVYPVTISAIYDDALSLRLSLSGTFPATGYSGAMSADAPMVLDASLV